ncbi:uncharacterized protein MELLADRAFT_69673 [Melampsora larici-populina 98AG31]|uniref:Uncharacterized protein n=1 Tax=Melampsora larici-populina (strain 98AG31 / pathotype 3-4-7) TaxID=747676 RepID=F4SBP8_MELLP|nr:uncharacterized protein MELLADRAFT_69673 [Melampsora larici-populina 98AG31]EGF97936.1 hypothetical protein MELLADRAFT_69673 [Melampsora larici-populina 98AG31]
MSNPTSPIAVVPSPRKALPATVKNTIMICDYMTKLGMSPKEFMVTFLSSTADEIVFRQRLSKIGLGARQTRSIFKNLGRLTSASNQGRDVWEKLILDEASKIVNAQEVTRAEFPVGGYVSSSAITPDFFSESAEKRRNELVQTALSMKKKQAARDSDDVMESSQNDTSSLGSDGAAPGETRIEGAVDDVTVMSMENLVFPLCNAIPVANGLMALAGGVSCRVHDWLHALGLASSRPTVLLAIDHFRQLQEKRMMDLFKINHKLMPFLCYDNVDINLKIHNTCVERNTRLFHGTWGYFNVIQPSLLAECTPEDLALPVFLDRMAVADRTPVDLSLFTPGPAESKHWRSVLKAQLAKALKDYITHIPGAPDVSKLPSLKMKPCPIDPIVMHKPNLHFLRMMDAPDSSAEGFQHNHEICAYCAHCEPGVCTEASPQVHQGYRFDSSGRL